MRQSSLSTTQKFNIIIILFFSFLFSQNNLTLSIKLSKSESGNSSEFGLESKNAIAYDVMYNHFITKSTFLGIGYSMESLTYDDLSSEIFDEADTVDYHGLSLELNQELINKNSFSFYGGIHYKHLWSISFNEFNTAFAVLTGDPEYLTTFDKSVGPGFQFGAKFKIEPNGNFLGLQYYKSDDWSGLKLQYGFSDLDQLRR